MVDSPSYRHMQTLQSVTRCSTKQVHTQSDHGWCNQILSRASGGQQAARESERERWVGYDEGRGTRAGRLIGSFVSYQVCASASRHPPCARCCAGRLDQLRRRVFDRRRCRMRQRPVRIQASLWERGGADLWEAPGCSWVCPVGKFC